MIAAPCSCASPRIRLASTRASASWELYCAVYPWNIAIQVGLSLLLGLLGLVHTALDGRGAVGIDLFELGYNFDLHDEVQDDERDEAEDQLAHVGQNGELVGLAGGHQGCDVRRGE